MLFGALQAPACLAHLTLEAPWGRSLLLSPASPLPPTTPTLALGRLFTGRSWSQYPHLRDFLNTQTKEAPIANISLV